MDGQASPVLWLGGAVSVSGLFGRWWGRGMGKIWHVPILGYSKAKIWLFKGMTGFEPPRSSTSPQPGCDLVPLASGGNPKKVP